MKKIMVRKGILIRTIFCLVPWNCPNVPTPGGSFEVLLRTHYWLRLWKEALLPTAFLSIFVVEPRSLMVEKTRMSRERKWMGHGLVSKWGKFHLLINGIYWVYKPLILTFDPNSLRHPSAGRRCLYVARSFEEDGKIITLQGTNITPWKVAGKMIFLMGYVLFARCRYSLVPLNRGWSICLSLMVDFF